MGSLVKDGELTETPNSDFPHRRRYLAQGAVKRHLKKRVLPSVWDFIFFWPRRSRRWCWSRRWWPLALLSPPTSTEFWKMFYLNCKITHTRPEASCSCSESRHRMVARIPMVRTLVPCHGNLMALIEEQDLPRQCTSLSIDPQHHCRHLRSISWEQFWVWAVFLAGAIVYLQVLCLLVFDVHHAFFHVQVFP